VLATAAGWSLAWVPTWAVLVDMDRGHHAFGSSGAILVTLLTGLTLQRLLAANEVVGGEVVGNEGRGRRVRPATSSGSAPAS
jgi:hypothetical protein